MYYNVLKNLRLLNVKAKKKMLIIFSCISMIILIIGTTPKKNASNPFDFLIFSLK